MEPRHTQEDTNEDVPTTIAHPDIVKRSLYRKYRWILFSLGTIAILGCIAFVLLAMNKRQTADSVKTINKASETTSHTNAQSSSVPTNHWNGSVNKVNIPLGDGRVSTTSAVGNVYSCTSHFTGGGVRHAGNWINDTNGTWNAETKVAVGGDVHWSTARYSETTDGKSRIINMNDLPMTYATGVFPISRNDPAYQYDTNPNHIIEQGLSYDLPLNPSAAASPGCLPLGPIGVLSDGVVLFNALDAGGRDAVAHETQDGCDGHPNGQQMYHYHDVPSCILSAATGASTLVGYALDGYGIYVERDSSGNLPINADLDACHGRTSEVMWNGQLTNIYHYDATLEYPYTLGCFHGSSTVSSGK